MKRMFSKLLPCLLAVLLVVGLVGCKKEEKYAHPSVEASISNGSEVFLELGQRQITNQTVYNRLVQTYGLTALAEWIDEITLENQEVVAEEFKEQLDYIIYGTTDVDDLDEEAKEKAYNAFVKQMYAQGYQTEEAWKAYYELEYKRYAFGLEKFEAYVNEKNASENEKDHAAQSTETISAGAADHEGTADLRHPFHAWCPKSTGRTEKGYRQSFRNRIKKCQRHFFELLLQCFLLPFTKAWLNTGNKGI
jgi:hypothetical protein